MRFWSKQHKILATTLVLALMTTLVAVASYAVWTASVTSSTNLFSTATINLTASTGTSAIATLENMVPGDSKSGVTDITASGQDLVNYRVVVGVTDTATLLATDATNGLQLEIRRCTAGYSSVDGSCAGGDTAVYPTGPILDGGSSRTISLTSNAFCLGTSSARGLTCDITGGVDHLKFIVSLPDGADATVAGKTNTFSFNFQADSPPGHAF